jgi:two-component system, chemotaxis family, sensor kinase CheA
VATEDDDILREFLIESAENLARLDQEMVALERQPGRQDLLAGVFRTIHTLKGTCGFLGFERLQALAHVTEDVLNELRQGRRTLDAALTSLILQSIDAIRHILDSIQRGAGEGEPFEAGVIAGLRSALDQNRQPAPPAQGVTSLAVGPAGSLPAEEPPGSAPQPVASPAATALRVDIALLDRLMDLVGELVLTRNQALQNSSARDDASLHSISQRLNLVTAELQDAVMKTRMQPIGLVWNMLPRTVRDLARSLGKEIDIEMEGAGTELDRTIVEAIKDPLVHIVRNSCDHGIEEPAVRLQAGKPARGRLSLRAYHENGQINVEISDDGAGIDPARVRAKAVERGLLAPDRAARLSDRDAVNLVFLPGFSTARQVTNVSGRGVGMDVVKTHTERIGGTVELVSEPGHGTLVRVRIPLTLAIIPGLVVAAGGERFLIPQVNLQELIRLEGEDARLIERVHSTPVLRRRNALLPVADLSHTLGLAPCRSKGECNIVVVQANGHSFGLIVDQIGDSQEIVVKPMGRQLKSLNCYTGSTIMGDGRIALIVDVVGLGLRAGTIAPSGQSGHAVAVAGGPAAEPSSRRALLLCRAGSFHRLAIPLAQVARLEQIPAARVERAGGRAAVQYRQRILPLLDLAEMLGEIAGKTEVLHVAVCRSGASELGLVVDEILDIVDEAIVNPHPAARPGLLASAVIGGQVTDFLDLEAARRWASIPSADDLARLAEAIGCASRPLVEVQP